MEMDPQSVLKTSRPISKRLGKHVRRIKRVLTAQTLIVPLKYRHESRLSVIIVAHGTGAEKMDIRDR